MTHHGRHDDEAPQTGEDESQQQLSQTAEHWRRGQVGAEAEEAAEEVARGAERGSEQPDYGREGS